MAPWWLRPTADGGDDKKAIEAVGPAVEPDSGPARPARRGRSRKAPTTPASLGELVEETAKVAQEPEVEASEEPESSDGRERRGRGRTRARRPRRVESGDETPAEAAPRAERAIRTVRGRARAAEVSEAVSVVVPPEASEASQKEIVISIPELSRSPEAERKLALFCDLENVALGARDSGSQFDINLVLERLVEKGKIVVKKAYADWSRYGDYKRAFHEAAIELIDIPQKRISGKNSADIKMVVDAMDISYAKEHLDTFVLLSGDSDFSPLVSKLKENNKYVIGVGVKGSSSALLIDNCDEFIYYEDISRDVERAPKLDSLPEKEKEVFGLLVESMLALIRENKDVLWGSMIKQTMQRKRPSFNEGYFGYSTFSDLLEDAEKKKVVKLEKDKRSGSYIVTGFAGGRGR